MEGPWPTPSTNTDTRPLADHLAPPAMAPLATREAIYLDQRFSAHAPLTIDNDFKI